MGAAAGAMGGMGGMSGKAGGIVGGAANFLIAKRTASTLKDIGAESAADIRRAGRKLGGRQVAAFAKAGVRTDVGTPVEVMASTAARVELDALRAVFQYETAAWQAKTQAGMQLIQSMLMLGGSAASSASQMKFGGGSVRQGGSTFSADLTSIGIDPSQYPLTTGQAGLFGGGAGVYTLPSGNVLSDSFWR